jgi:hypothetical protein
MRAWLVQDAAVSLETKQHHVLGTAQLLHDMTRANSTHAKAAAYNLSLHDSVAKKKQE